MRTGTLNKRIEIHRLSISQSDTGQPTETWQLYREVWAAVLPVNGQERLAGGEILSDIDINFKIHYLKGLSPKYHRIKYRGVLYDIALIKDIGFNEALMISAQARAIPDQTDSSAGGNLGNDATPAGIVRSVFGRVGDVVAAIGDYSITMITGAGTAAQYAVEYFALAIHNHVASEITNFSSAVDTEVATLIGVTVQGYDANTVKKNVANGYSKQQYAAAVALISTSNHIAWNLDDAQAAEHAATESTQLDNPTNMHAGATYTFKFTQNASAAKNLTFGSAYKWPGGIVPTQTNTLSAVDIYSFYCDGTYMYGVVQQGLA